MFLLNISVYTLLLKILKVKNHFTIISKFEKFKKNLIIVINNNIRKNAYIF